MKNPIKRAIALLSASLLLASSASVYAAQAPASEADVSPISVSKQSKTSMSISLSSYEHSPDRLVANISITAGNYQFRGLTSNYTVAKETGAGTSVFQTVATGTGQFSSLRIETPICVSTGARIRISISATGTAFDGYIPIGDLSGSNTFYITSPY